MNGSFAYFLRRLCTAAACAAAPLASFEDEALSATAVAREVSSQEGPDPADAFPDLFQSARQADVDAAGCPAETPRGTAVEPRRSLHPPVTRLAARRSAAVLFGVWRI